MYTPKNKKQIYTKGQQETILKAITSLRLEDWEKDYVFVSLLLKQGTRYKETLKTRLQDLYLNQENPQWRIPAKHNKCRREEFIELRHDIAGLLKNFITKYKHRFQTNKEGETFIFFPTRSRDNRTGQVLVMNFYYRWYIYLKRAGLNEISYKGQRDGELTRNMYKFRIHDFRRTFCNEAREANPQMDIIELSRVTRHKSLDVLNNIYLEIDEGKIRREAMNNMESHYF